MHSVHSPAAGCLMLLCIRGVFHVAGKMDVSHCSNCPIMLRENVEALRNEDSQYSPFFMKNEKVVSTFSRKCKKCMGHILPFFGPGATLFTIGNPIMQKKIVLVDEIVVPSITPFRRNNYGNKVDKLLEAKLHGIL